MTEQAKKYLSDIRTAIDRIQSFTIGLDTYEQYQDDLKTQSAVERQLGIIGEATGQYRKLNDAVLLEHIHQIVGFRNRIIHSYDSLDNTLIWAVLQNHLPLLSIQINRILGE